MLEPTEEKWLAAIIWNIWCPQWFFLFKSVLHSGQEHENLIIVGKGTEHLRDGIMWWKKIYALLAEKHEEGTFFLPVNGIKVILPLQVCCFIYKMEIIPPTSLGFCMDNMSQGIADRPVDGRQVLSSHTHSFHSLHSRWLGCWTLTHHLEHCAHSESPRKFFFVAVLYFYPTDFFPCHTPLLLWSWKSRAVGTIHT